jgi:PAS domain S-box-containing protein
VAESDAVTPAASTPTGRRPSAVWPILDRGLRPIPWPPWSGRYGSSRAALWIAGLWLASLAAGVGVRAVAARQLSSGAAGSAYFLYIAGANLPWTLAVIWTLYAGWEYALALLIACAAIVANPVVETTWLSEPAALISLAVLLNAFPIEARLRGLGSLAYFITVIFCASVATATGAIAHGFSTDQLLVETLATWDRTWISHFLHDSVITIPIALLAGPLLEKAKSSLFGWLPAIRPTARLRIFALLAGMLMVVVFCVIWTMTTEIQVSHAIQKLVKDPDDRDVLLQKLRAADFRDGALVALLLGTVCGGASLLVLLFQRYQDELKAEVQRGTEALRRGHLQLAALQQITEASSRSLDPDLVFQQMAQSMARLADAAQTTVYVPDDLHAGSLRLVQQVCLRPENFNHPLYLSIEETPTGESFRTGKIVSISRGLHEKINDPQRSADLQQHNLQALLSVPILSEHNTLGVVRMLFDNPYSPDEEEQRMFRLIGRAVGAAAERAETHAQARRYAGDLGGLYRFSQELAMESSEQRILEVAAGSARKVMSAQSVAAFAGVPAGASEASASGEKVIKLKCVALDSSSTDSDAIRRLEFDSEQPGSIGDALRETRSVSAVAQNSDTVLLVENWRAKSALVIPLAYSASGGDAVPGNIASVMVWTFETPRKLGVEEIGLAEELGRQTAEGLRRARLAETTRRQAAELTILEQIGRSLSQRLSTADTLDQLVRQVNKIVPAEWASVFALEPESKVLTTRATTFPQPEAREIRIPIDSHSLVALCMKEGRSMVSPDMNNDPRANPERNRLFKTASGALVPLGPAGQRFGVLMVNNSRTYSFNADDVRRLEQLAQLASVSIERARIYDEACQRADELILLNEVGHLLVENPALESTLERIADLVSRNFQATGAGFMLATEQGDALITRGVSIAHREQLKYTRVPLELDGITTLAFKQNRVVNIEDTEKDKRINPMLFSLIPGVRSGVLIPMAGAHGPVGLFGLWRTQPHRYSPRDLQCLGSIARLAAAAVERDELGKALRASEARVQEIVDGVHAMMFSVDARGNIISFNAAAERISGWKREAAIGQPLSRVVNPRASEQTKVEAAIGKSFVELDCGGEVTLNWATPEGRERKIRMSASFLRGADSKPIGMVCLGIDITDQLLLEAQLLQAQKMESVGALAGGMAHDFNNLLGGVIGQCVLARAVLTTVRTNPNVDRNAVNELNVCLTRIESAAQRGADLTAKLMAFARKSVIQPQEVDMPALIRETSELLRGSLPRNIEVIPDIAADLDKVYGDPTQLQQVLLNLCVNARDAMPTGGTLRISARPQPDSAGVLLEIGDTGTGMGEEVQKHLFEPFFTTKGPGKGTGLGLSVVFGIVRSHGGHINVFSQPGKGTRFCIRLPSTLRRTIPAAMRLSRSGSSMRAVQRSSSALHKAVTFGGNEKLLLIDDDSMLRDTMFQLLANLGYKVHVEPSGADALKFIDSTPGFVPNVVLLDVVMPGLSGLPLFHELRKRLPSTPVILMSGYSADQTVTEMLNAGAQELVQKPFPIESLAGAIRRAADGEPVR